MLIDFVFLTLWDFVLCGIDPCAFAYWRCLKLHISIRVWGVFLFSEQLPEALVGEFPVPFLWWQQHFWLAPFSQLSHFQACPTLAQLHDNILAAISLTALLILPGFGQWYLFFRDAGTWNSSPAHLGPAMASEHLHCLFFGDSFAWKGKPQNEDLKYCILKRGGNLLVWNFEK